MTIAQPLIEAPTQAVILLDRAGSQAGGRPDAQALADVADRAFLDYLLETCARFGFDDVLLLSRPDACERVVRFAETAAARLRPATRIAVERRPEEGGDLAALRGLGARLAEHFLLLDGQSLFGFNWLDLMLGAAASRAPLVVAAEGACDAGQRRSVFLVSRNILERLGNAEEHSFASLVHASGLAVTRSYDAFFVDLGAPGGLARAQSELPRWRQRPALFFDRDGTVNVEVGYAFRPEQLQFVPGAIAAVKRANDSGRYAFLVTNQSGIARGYYALADMHRFHAELQRRLRAAGAHFDDVRYCPYHPDGTVPEFARESDWRKPAPGMFLDLLRSWPVIRADSLAVGDMARDVQAAEAAGIRAIQYRGGDLDALLARYF